MNKHWAWLLLFCTLAPSLAKTARAEESDKPVGYQLKSGDASVRIAVPANQAGQLEIRLSDTIEVIFTVTGAETMEVVPLPAPTASKDWQLLRHPEPQRKALDARRVTWQQTFTIAPVRPGDVPLPLNPLRYRQDPNDERWQEASWKSVPVQVATEIQHADLSELRGSTGPEELPETPVKPSWVPWIAGLAAIALATLAGYWLYWRRRQGPPAPLPAQWAIRELDRLPLPTHASPYAVEQFHTEVCDVIRKYLELQFHLPALEQTTAEFFASVRQSPTGTIPEQALLQDFLQQCDLVKFARARPSAEECQGAVSKARRFVEQTAGANYDSACGQPSLDGWQRTKDQPLPQSPQG